MAGINSNVSFHDAVHDTTADIRSSYVKLPAYTQNFFTWLTGKALPNQKPLFVLSKWVHFFVPLSLFISSIIANYYCLSGGMSLKLLLVPIFWIFTVAGTRNMVLTIRHECVHNCFSKSSRVNKFIGEFVTTILLVRTAKAYQFDHVSMHHNSDILCSKTDPHIIYLESFGLKLGMSKHALWKQLIITLLSPKFYIKSTYERILANVLAKNKARRFFGILYILACIFTVVYFSLPIYKVFFSFIFPLFVLSTASSLLETINEHPSPSEAAASSINDKKQLTALKCWSVLSGSPFPKSTNSIAKDILNVASWFIHMLGHLVVRLTIMPGPLPSHEMHHRRPGQYDWRIAFYEKQKDIDSGHPGWPPYREVWGFINSLDMVFDDMSKREPM